MTILRPLYIMGVLTALALCVVWQSQEVRRAGYCLERLHEEADVRTAEIQLHEAQIGRLSSPQRITHLVETLDLDLVQPSVPRPEEPTPAAPSDDSEHIFESDD